MELKIGRHTYKITELDRFLDNGKCVQLCTQSKEKSSWGKAPSPVLPKRAIRDLNAVGIVQYASPYPSCKWYGIAAPSGEAT